jgi:hypothetical protein
LIEKYRIEFNKNLEALLDSILPSLELNYKEHIKIDCENEIIRFYENLLKDVTSAFDSQTNILSRSNKRRISSAH